MKQFIDYIWNTRWALTLTAGILLGLSYPPVPLPFLIFPAFLLIFRIIDLSDTARESAYWTYPAFLIWNLITTYWLMLATLAGGIAAIVANAAVMTVPVMLQHKINQQKIQPWLIALLQAACWITYEYLHHQWDLAWPWLTVANAWANVPQLVQYISITGYWGITLWVLFSTALAYQFIIKPERSIKLTLSAIVLIFPLWSVVILAISSSTQTKLKTQEVVVVQPNFDSYERYGGYDSPFAAINQLLRLTDSVRTQNTKLVVWPENAVQSDVSNLDSFGDVASDTKALLGERAKNWNATLITGATFFEIYNAGEEPPLPYPYGQRYMLPFNAALAFYPDQPMEIYRKHNLVPIVERVPFVHFLNAIDVFGWVNWNQNQGYGKGNQDNQFKVGNTETPALICYDSVFPSWVREYVVDGAGYLTVITNDGWWGNTSGHEQHFAYARLRAIEFRRLVVRSANNGISGIIDSDGSVLVETPYWEATAFRYDVPVSSYQTIYAQFGDWLPILMLICSVVGLGYFWVMPFFRREKSDPAPSKESVKET